MKILIIYKNFFEYKKTLAKNKFLKYDEIDKDEYDSRTNNICEWFHKNLND